MRTHRFGLLAYENGAYDDIDYSEPPEPPLDNEQAEWAVKLLKRKRSRK
jgi:hypothetical protein